MMTAYNSTVRLSSSTHGSASAKLLARRQHRATECPDAISVQSPNAGMPIVMLFWWLL